MVTINFWLPPYDNCGNRKNLIATKGWLVASFLKALVEGFLKACDMLPFLVTKNNSIATSLATKNFGHRKVW